MDENTQSSDTQVLDKPDNEESTKDDNSQDDSAKNSDKDNTPDGTAKNHRPQIDPLKPPKARKKRTPKFKIEVPSKFVLTSGNASVVAAASKNLLPELRSQLMAFLSRQKIYGRIKTEAKEGRINICGRAVGVLVVIPDTGYATKLEDGRWVWKHRCLIKKRSIEDRLLVNTHLGPFFRTPVWYYARSAQQKVK